MFCRRCGKQIANNQEYCQECKKINESIQQPENVFGSQNANYRQYTNFVQNTDFHQNNQRIKKKCCPNCRSNKLQVVPKTNFESKFEAKGYGIFKGCCGYLIFGPIGILCGLCGSKAKNSVKISSTNVWICLDCGEKFRDISDIEKDIKKFRSNRIIIPLLVSLFFAIPAICLFIAFLMEALFYDASSVGAAVGSGIAAAILTIWDIWEFMDASKKLYACLDEKQYIEKYGYEYR